MHSPSLLYPGSSNSPPSFSSLPSSHPQTATDAPPPPISSPSSNMAAAAVPMMPPQHSGHHSLHDDSRQDLPRPYKCPLCDKAFHRLEHQTRHIRTHTGEKPHACQFPGCTKRFSRSDELTRHSRIHNNQHARRGNKSHNANATATAAANILVSGSFQDSHMSQTMPPLARTYSRSAPNSSLVSPNISPSHSYTHGASRMAGGFYPGYQTNGETLSTVPQPQQQALDINMLANAASQVQREDEQQSLMHSNARSRPPNHHPHHPPHHYAHHHHPYALPGSNGTRLPPLSAYAMSRSHSQESEDHMARYWRRSRAGSPKSTAPSSPTFSNNDSHSPTPGHTPSATPAHSPRIGPHRAHSDVHLPGIRHLSLQYSPNQAPSHLEPLEPSDVGPSPNGPSHTSYQRTGASSNGMSISDIISGPEHTSYRKLPVPDLLNGPSNGSAAR